MSDDILKDLTAWIASRPSKTMTAWALILNLSVTGSSFVPRHGQK
jgi:hypothetical protein